MYLEGKDDIRLMFTLCLQVDTSMPLTVQGVGVVELTARIKVTDVRLEGGDAPAVQ